MTTNKIYELAKKFRMAIENARDDDKFVGDIFDRFPKRCCGDTSCLLAEFLRSYGIDCIYVWGYDAEDQSHAWIVVNDKRIKEPKKSSSGCPNDIVKVLYTYGSKRDRTLIPINNYKESDVIDGLIIDITADKLVAVQFMLVILVISIKDLNFVQLKKTKR